MGKAYFITAVSIQNSKLTAEEVQLLDHVMTKQMEPQPKVEGTRLRYKSVKQVL